jgi:dihydrofolate reductase
VVKIRGKKMRKIILYIAASLNNKIATPDGSVAWLDEIPNPEKTDYGYAEFLSSIDTTIQGYNTYQQLVDWGIEFPYKDKKNYVFSRKPDRFNNGYVEFITEDKIEYFRALKNTEGKDIWVIGGGQINTIFLNAGLIDEIRLFVMPVILSGGIDLFDEVPLATKLNLISSRTYNSGVVENTYQIEH